MVYLVTVTASSPAGIGCASERYRDLIEAADTITEMKRSSDSVSCVFYLQFLMIMFELFLCCCVRKGSKKSSLVI